MLSFILRRLGVMLLTMLCLSFVVFFFVNLDPNLRKLAIFQTEMRASDQDLENWLQRNGYRDNFFVRFGRWVGVWPKEPAIDPATGQAVSRFRFCDEPAETRFSGVLEGDFGCSTAFRTPVAAAAARSSQGDGHPDVLGHDRDGAGIAPGRRARRHARGVQARPGPVGRFDRVHGDARIRVGHHLHRDPGVLARLAQRLGGDGDHQGHQLQQLHPAGDDHGHLRNRLYRAHDPRLDGRGHDGPVHPHRPPQGPELRRGRRQARPAQRA